MVTDHIDDSELLYRVVRKSYPDGFINGIPSAALFLDKNGCSVERDYYRDEKSVIVSLKSRFRKNDDYLASVRLSAGECREIETYPVAINNQTNRYHAEIHESVDVIPISLLKAIKLAEICKVV